MILDTTFLIDLMDDDQEAKIKLAQLIKNNDMKMITAISVFELFIGIGKGDNPKEEKEKVEKILSGEIILEFSEEAAATSGLISGSLSKLGKNISKADCMIAGIALTKNQKVLTRNVKDFGKIEGLQIETY